MSSQNDPPLSLRPFPVADQFKPKTLAEFVARVNAQPGGFRSVTEPKIREQLNTTLAQDAPEPASSPSRYPSMSPSANEDADADADADADDAADDDDAPRVATKDPELARMEVLRDIDLAGNIALLTLDSMSLLLSKQNPTQAGLALSQQLRELVGIGTMGMDKLTDSNATPAKTLDRETVALGWTLMETNKTRDAAEEAALFLGREVDAEAAYWEDIISVHKAGWSICKLDRHTLGVKFGFSEAAPEFKANGAAPMRRGDNGATVLDLDKLGGVSENLVVTYEKDGHVVGRSSLRSAAPDSSSLQLQALQARVLDARDTIFSQELWHELLRESRCLLAYDVKTQGSRLVYTISPSDRLVFELLPVSSSSSSDDHLLPENKTAEAVSMALHLLLSYAHRFNEQTRIRPVPPHITRLAGQQPHPLLRPVISRITALRNIESSTRYVGALTRSLRAAGVPASFVLRTPQLSPADPNAARLAPNQLSGSYALIRNMLSLQDFVFTLNLLPGLALRIRGRSFMFPVTATYYYVLLPEASPLRVMCPPSADGYTDFPALMAYVRTAVARALADYFLRVLGAERPGKLVMGMQGTSIRDDMGRDALDLRFAVEHDEEGMPSLALYCLDLADAGRQWRWTADQEVAEMSLEQAVRSVVDEI